jgi:hypothetical protein
VYEPISFFKITDQSIAVLSVEEEIEEEFSVRWWRGLPRRPILRRLFERILNEASISWFLNDYAVHGKEYFGMSTERRDGLFVL